MKGGAISKAETHGDKQNRIDGLNRMIRNCEKCGLAATRRHALVGEGNPDARLMLIALSPGETEDVQNRMFIGPSGQVLDMLLQEAGIDRRFLYMTNLVKCMLPKNRRPKMIEIESCSDYWREEIQIIQPEFLVALGYYAARSVFNEYELAYPESKAEFPEVYGKLRFAASQKILPLPHPASLLYHPQYKEETIAQYKKLQTLSADCIWFPACPIKRFYEKGLLDRKWVELYCRGDWANCVRYRLEAEGKYHPDWMLPDGSDAETLKENNRNR